MHRVLLLALVVTLAACGGPPPIATAADAERAHVALEDLQRGRELLIKKCSGCHATPRPSDHAAAKWPKKVADMTERAHLHPDERALIESYLVALDTR